MPSGSLREPKKTDEELCEQLNTPTVPLTRELKNVAKRSFTTSASAAAPPKNSSHKINLTAKTANNAAQNARLRCKLYTKQTKPLFSIGSR